MEAKVFQQGHLTIFKFTNGFLRRRADAVFGEPDLGVQQMLVFEQMRQFLGHGKQG